ncbi:MAG: response regulator transcription factor [Erysipelotrichaceae bacterium]
MPSKIMIADDNPEIREIINVLLSSEGYLVIEAEDGEDALSKLDMDIDLIILDIMMPHMDGYKSCRLMRERSKAPILFLSAKSQDSDKALGFSSGGDDYLSKPFSYNELMARVKALLRRYQVYQGKDGEEKKQENTIQIRDLKINETTQKVMLREQSLLLTDIEFHILLLLMKHPGYIYTAQMLYETIWDEPYFYSANNTIMVHIRNLRKKIEKDPQNPEYIKTIWGKGYRCDS